MSERFDLSFEQFKAIYNAVGGEPEFEICFSNKSSEYMIIKYKNEVSFQRCGIENGSGEVFFDSLDELFSATTIDNICLKEQWTNIEYIVMETMYNLFDRNDYITVCRTYRALRGLDIMGIN